MLIFVVPKGRKGKGNTLEYSFRCNFNIIYTISKRSTATLSQRNSTDTNITNLRIKELLVIPLFLSCTDNRLCIVLEHSSQHYSTLPFWNTSRQYPCIFVF